MATPKEMLSAILRRATLKPSEKEGFEDLWDKVHRYGRVTHKQGAWIEKVYYGQKLDKEPVKVGSVRLADVTKPFEVLSLSQFEKTCPQVAKDSTQYKKIAAFFQGGGTILKVRPPEGA